MRLASVSLDCSVIFWDFKNKTLIKQMKNHTDSVNCLEYSNDGEHLASGSDDKSVIIWDSQ